jgi:DNA primase large subunit
MDFNPSAKELSHFPFLKKAQLHIRNRFSSLDLLFNDKKGELLIDRALGRIQDALTQKKPSPPEITASAENEIAGYALARIIVSCAHDKTLMDRLTRYESERAYFFLVNEEDWNQNYHPGDGEYSRLCIALAQELGLQITNERIPFADYVELVSPMHQDRFNLVNRRLEHGFVDIKKDERYELLRERIRVLLRRDLPHKVPSSVCEKLAPRIALLKKVYQEQMLQQFGSIEETLFPPCIQAMITALTTGTNLTHSGRFAITTFLHTIGMDPNAIGELYARSPDFDADKTMYQVEHITGRGGSGTEYNAPACAAMRTTGLCIHPDALCERINHPLNYYRAKKRDQSSDPMKKT